MKKQFDIYDIREQFPWMCLNRRTVNAWEYGAESVALHKPLIYQGCASDYAAAEMAGASWAREQLAAGRSYKCSECGHLHSGRIS